MKALLLTALTAGILAAMPALAGEQTARTDVADMTCPSCSFTVATAMKRVPTVEILRFEESDAFGEGVFVVSYDDTVATPQMIVEAVMANGYPARVLPAEES